MEASPAPHAWIIDSAPALPVTGLRVDWPARGLDPFDLTERRTQRMYYASGYTRAFPAEEDYGAYDDRAVADAVPHGYTALSLLEKLAVVHDGILIAEWPRSPAPTFAGAARADDGPRRLVPMVAFQTVRTVWAAHDPSWLAQARAGRPVRPQPAANAVEMLSTNGYASALDKALALSAVLGREPVMVVDVLESVDWH
ncbi:hypothetical protein [Krasilnikovia sp. MM14-A1259]|uniref:hypothetical protein n=1 Tax=Krasilnikovia sp. MM14-A1259 TaxID=3373539 RepID=UPI00382DBBA3